MKRSILLTLAVTVIATIGIAIGASKPISGGNKTSLKPASLATLQDGHGTIDGAKNPELIPDRTAYTLLFRLIANRQTDEEKNRIRAYIRQMGLGNGECQSCSKAEKAQAKGDDKDIDALIAAAEEFEQRVGVLDDRAVEIKHNRLITNPERAAQLSGLQQQKEAIVDEIIASFPQHMSAVGREKMRQHVNEHVKRKVKMDAPRNS